MRRSAFKSEGKTGRMEASEGRLAGRGGIVKSEVSAASRGSAGVAIVWAGGGGGGGDDFAEDEEDEVVDMSFDEGGGAY